MGTVAKKRLAFIDHSFHKATGSADFFQEILCRFYDVTVFFDDAWRGGPPVDLHLINTGQFEIVIFWQIVPDVHDTRRLTCKNILWVPMYDSIWQRSRWFWLTMRGLDLKVFCFSKLLYTVTRRYGLNSFYAQYFPELAERAVSYGSPRVFFWQRINEISWPVVKQLLGETEVERVVLRDDPDPSHHFTEPNTEDVDTFHIEVIRDLKVAGGSNRDNYLRLLSTCNVFIAPRSLEGIGLSFLEAMARGMCVMGADAPTMNEYISHGTNGFLFEPERANSIDLSDFAKCGINARAEIARGREQWQASLPAILHFVDEPGAGRRPFLTALLLLGRTALFVGDLARRSRIALAEWRRPASRSDQG